MNRHSRQREIILSVLKGTNSHPTADWIYQEVRNIIPNISLGTVYRNLKLLKEMGELRELNLGDGHSRYDGHPGNHYHFTCESCGSIYDVERPVISDMEEMAGELGCIVLRHSVELYGRCRSCIENTNGGDL